MIRELDNKLHADPYGDEDIGPGTIALALIALTLAIAAYLLG